MWRPISLTMDSGPRTLDSVADVSAGRVVAALLDTGPDVDHRAGHAHRRLNRQLPVAGTAVI